MRLLNTKQIGTASRPTRRNFTMVGLHYRLCNRAKITLLVPAARPANAGGICFLRLNWEGVGLSTSSLRRSTRGLSKGRSHPMRRVHDLSLQISRVALQDIGEVYQVSRRRHRARRCGRACRYRRRGREFTDGRTAHDRFQKSSA